MAELWLVLSILAPALWAVTNVIDKVVVYRYVKNPFIPMFVSGLVTLAVSIAAIILFPFPQLAAGIIALSIASGFFWASGVFVYFRALLYEEASRIISLIMITPLFVLMLAAFFLNEVFGYVTYAGIFSIIAGSFLITIKSMSAKNISFRRPLILVLLAPLMFSIFDVVSKHVLYTVPFWNFFPLFGIGYFITSAVMISLFSRYRKDMFNFRKFGGKILGMMVVSESINVSAMAVFVTAISLGFVSLVSAVSSVQPLFTLAYVLLVGFFMPRILNEQTEKKTVLLKIAAILLIVFGIFVIG